ncbi:MAG: Ig-like domain-containing protein [Balneolaceae bacterium]
MLNREYRNRESGVRRRVWLVCGLFLLLSGMVWSCATPRGPSGGEPDRTPPEITGTSPGNETVNFRGREIEFRFSKFMNRNSIQEALTIEPDLAVPYEIDWGRRSVTVRFEQELPENTTILLKLGTELQDFRNNNLSAPFDFALSTGPVIDDGTVIGRIIHAGSGERESGMRVYLYRDPVDFDSPANYVAQTDTGGVFRFSHLAEDSYTAIWMDDLNRNRIWEREREAVQPFRDSLFQLGREEVYDLGTIFVQRPDTTAPELRGVGLLTETRLRLRFNEEIYWEDDASITVLDTLGVPFTTAWPLYVPPEDLMVVLAQSDEPLPEDQRFTLEFEGMADSGGNSILSVVEPFAGSAQPDTVSLRIIGDNREPGLNPDQPLIVGYSRFIDDQNVTDSLRVVEGEEMNIGWPHAEIRRHRLYIYPDGEWLSGTSYQFLVWNPARQVLRPIEPRIWQRNQFGSIEITLADTNRTEPYRLRLFDEESNLFADTTFTGSVAVEQLPPLTYRVEIFRDSLLSGIWDSGSVIPFRVPEPYYIRPGIPVREGFSSELTVRFWEETEVEPEPEEESPEREPGFEGQPGELD